MVFCSQFKALLKKNFLLWRRNLYGSLCEILFPLVLMLLTLTFRFSLKEKDKEPRSYIDDCFHGYYFDNNVQTYIDNPNTPDWMGLCKANPFTSCIKFSRSIIGFVINDNALYTQLETSLLGAGGSNFLFNFVALAGLPMVFTAKRFNSESELENYAGHDDYDSDSMPGLCAGIVIYGSGNDFTVKLRYDDNHLIDSDKRKQQIPTTKREVVDPFNKNPHEEEYEMYHMSGFTYLQYLIIKALGGSSINSLKVGVLPMRTDEYKEDEFLDGPAEMVGILVVLCYLVPIFKLVSMIVQDKELNTREGMKIMGLKDTAYWVSLFVYYSIIFVVIALLLSIFVSLLVYKKVNWFILFLFFLLYGLSIYSFGFFISTFFHRARIAGIAAAMIYCCLYSTSSLINSEEVNVSMGPHAKRALSLFPTIAASLGSSIILKFEAGQQSLNFSRINDVVDDLKFSEVLLMLFVDIIMYMILGLYLDNVIPMPSGVRKPLHFFLTKEFWSTNKKSTEKRLSIQDDSKILYINNYFERIGEDMKVQEASDDCMKIRHLHKFFGSKHSVVDLSLNLYRGQIFTLLGPNGAGKTTTISMLSGLLPPSSGGATFSGIEVFKEMGKMRTMLGVCPQHDVLFEKLTSKEHLEIFAAFKGKSSREKEVQEILDDMELNDCVDVVAEKLSGGQRRKLSIGMAFIGNSDIIFLDEPTSGIDINSRKGVWAMLKKYKQDKIIILTTHYMEEAEELGDRIGIMTHGSLKCVGTPLFLKTVYGAGYNLTVVYDNLGKEQHNQVQQNITEYLKTRMNDITVKKITEREAVYFLHKSKAKDLKELFSDLDEQLKTLKIQSYGIATNSLEEIFLQVASEDEVTAANKQKYAIEMPSSDNANSADDTELDSYSIMNETEAPFFSSFMVHFYAIVMKRVYVSLRNWIGFLVDIIVPIIIILVALLLTKVKLYYNSDPRWFYLILYSSPQSILINSMDNSGISTNSFTQYLDPYLIPSDRIITFSNSTDKNALKSMEKTLFDERGHERYGSLLINKLDTTNKDFEYIVFPNIISQDSAGAFMSYFGQALLKLAKNDPNYSLTFVNSPLPMTYEAKGKENAKNGDIVAPTIAVALALIPSNVISFIVQEREGNLKHQQVITGVSLFAYWSANCVIDMIRSLIPSSLSISLIYIFNVDLPYSWLFMILYSFAIIPFTYFTSFFFVKESIAQTVTLLFHFFTGMLLSVLTSILRSFDSTRSGAKGLQWVLRIFPSFSLANGIYNICHKDVYAIMEGKNPEENLSFAVSGGDVMFLCIILPVSILLIVFFESGIFSCLLSCCKPFKIIDNDSITEKDKLVLKEEKLCDNVALDSNPPAVLAKHLTKVYQVNSKKTVMAVNDITFNVNLGECLALLGTSGAGKTTTFKLLTRDIVPTNGEIFIKGMELRENFATIRKMIGYGPQYESAFMSMTVKENLEFYAMLKGIPKKIRSKLIKKLIVDMDLIEFENVLVGNLSGGNKRKTTVAIALLGNPPIIFLDEPSTGVDPQSKRFMWQVIQRISIGGKNTAFILTTHSMEEAEYLCTKMAIMTAGSFCSIGSPQELKENFGKGYEIQVSIPTPSANEENEYLTKMKLTATTGMKYEDVTALFNNIGKPELKEQLDAKGTAAHLMAEINTKGSVQGRLVANYLLIQQRGFEIAQTLANEFGETKIPEHIGNFFKFRVDKINDKQTIGFLFGLLQGVIEKYKITQYSATQTSLNQIFQTLSKMNRQQDLMTIKSLKNTNKEKGNKIQLVL